MRKIILILTVIPAFFMMTNSSLSLAQSQNDAANFLVDIGERAYREGKIEEAAHEFKKALMLDPNHRKAKQYLENLGIEAGYVSPESYEAKVIHLTQDLKKFEQKAERLEQEKKDTEHRLAHLQSKGEDLYRSNLAKEMELSLVQEKAQKVSSEASYQAQAYEQRTQELKGYYAQQNKIFLDEMGKKSKELSKKVLSSQKQGVDLALSDTKVNDALDRALRYQEQALQLKSENRNLSERLSEERFLRNSLDKINEDYVYIRNQELGRLQDETVAKEIDLTKEQDHHVKYLDQAIEAQESADTLRNEVYTAQEQMSDKNADLAFLKQKLEDANSDLSKKQEEIVALQKELAQAQGMIEKSKGNH